MRTFLGLFVLLLLFASAAAWQGRLTHDLRRRQDQHRGAPLQDDSRATPSRETLSAGWNTLLVGRPSGADPFFERPQSRQRDPARQPRRGARDPESTTVPAREEPRDALPPPIPRYEPDFQITVRPGDVLSKLCQGHYRTRPDGLSLADVIGAVARYNGLSSPDAIQVGGVIRLPDVDRFVEAD